jgi:short-subunit dehydrogenase
LESKSDILTKNKGSKEPMRVAITGASGNISYALAFRVAR